MKNSATIIRNASRAGLAVPAFNVPYLPMIEPILRAASDLHSAIFIEVARIEWLKFECRGPEEVAAEFFKWADMSYARLHLDHIPVIDEDGAHVDYLDLIRRAIDLGYHSVMVDGSALEIERNIDETRRAVEVAHDAGIPCEAELGAIVREGGGPSPSYEELFSTARGFTDIDDAARFVRETGCDWLSVAVGNIHGAVSGLLRTQKKTEARVHLAHLDKLRESTDIPLVLHGGSGINKKYMREAIRRGICKVNIGFDIRRAYESALQRGGRGKKKNAQEAVYARSVALLDSFFGLKNSGKILLGGDEA